MRVITRGLVASLNYGAKGEVYRSFFGGIYDKAFELFKTHRAGTGSFFIPKHWAPSIINIINNMLDIDPYIKLVKIAERFGRLRIEFIPSKEDVNFEIIDLIYKVQQHLDDVSHSLVDRFLDKDPYMKSMCEKEKWLLLRGVLLLEKN